MNINELLDKAKVITGSDTETGRRIGAQQTHMAQVRMGIRGLTDYQIAQIAEIVGERWYDVTLPYKADRAKTEAERKFWLGKLETLLRTGGAAAMIVAGLTINNVSTLEHAQSAEKSSKIADVEGNVRIFGHKETL